MGALNNCILVLLIAVLVGCSSDETPKTQEQVAADNAEKIKKITESVKLSVSDNTPIDRIQAVIESLDEIEDEIQDAQFFNNQIINIRLKAHDSTDYLTVVHTAENAKKVMDALKKENVTDLKQFNVMQNVTLVDKYNNKHDSELYTLKYNYPELMKFNSDGSTTYFNFLKFAEYSANNRLGSETFLNFCLEGAQFTGDFCKIR